MNWAISKLVYSETYLIKWHCNSKKKDFYKVDFKDRLFSYIFLNFDAENILHYYCLIFVTLLISIINYLFCFSNILLLFGYSQWNLLKRINIFLKWRLI